MPFVLIYGFLSASQQQCSACGASAVFPHGCFVISNPFRVYTWQQRHLLRQGAMQAIARILGHVGADPAVMPDHRAVAPGSPQSFPHSPRHGYRGKPCIYYGRATRWAKLTCKLSWTCCYLGSSWEFDRRPLGTFWTTARSLGANEYHRSCRYDYFPILLCPSGCHSLAQPTRGLAVVVAPGTSSGLS